MAVNLAELRCPTCRADWPPQAAELLHTACRSQHVSLPPPAVEHDTVSAEHQATHAPPAPRHILPLCCPRVFFARPSQATDDAAWEELPDRNMEWAPTFQRADSTWTPEWLCLRCNTTLDAAIPCYSRCLTAPYARHMAPVSFARALEVGFVAEEPRRKFFLVHPCKSPRRRHQPMPRCRLTLPRLAPRCSRSVLGTPRLRLCHKRTCRPRMAGSLCCTRPPAACTTKPNELGKRAASAALGTRGCSSFGRLVRSRPLHLSMRCKQPSSSRSLMAAPCHRVRRTSCKVCTVKPCRCRPPLSCIWCGLVSGSRCRVATSRRRGESGQASCRSLHRLPLLPLKPSAHLARKVQLVPNGPCTLHTSASCRLSAAREALLATPLAPRCNYPRCTA